MKMFSRIIMRIKILFGKPYIVKHEYPSYSKFQVKKLGRYGIAVLDSDHEFCEFSKNSFFSLEEAEKALSTYREKKRFPIKTLVM